MLDRQTGHQSKFKINLYKTGDLLYWSDYWNTTYGIGIFLEYVNDFNVEDIYSTDSSKTSPTWVNLLITKNSKLDIKMFPQTSVSVSHNYQCIEDFQEHVSKFRFKRNK